MTSRCTGAQDEAFVFDKAEKDFDLVFNAIRTGRSLAAQYNLQSDIQREHLTTNFRRLIH